jgi:hypothetical protein
LVLTGLALAGILACSVGRGIVDAHRVYTVMQVQAGLARDAKVWVNRTVLVRGRIMQGYWMRGRVGFTWGLAEYCATTPLGCPSDSPPGGLIPPGTVVHLGLRSDGLDSENHYLPILILVPQPAGASLLFLRRNPLVASIVPAPQYVQWGTLATYQIHILHKVRRNACTPLCDDAVLLNVAR